jgi:hypothetical protein
MIQKSLWIQWRLTKQKKMLCAYNSPNEKSEAASESGRACRGKIVALPTLTGESGRYSIVVCEGISSNIDKGGKVGGSVGDRARAGERWRRTEISESNSLNLWIDNL